MLHRAVLLDGKAVVQHVGSLLAPDTSVIQRPCYQITLLYPLMFLRWQNIHLYAVV